MTMLQAGLVPSTGGGYQIERSLRFNSADSAYLNRTPASSPTSNQKFTLSCWFKRTALGGVYPSIYCANDAQVGGGYPVIAFSNSTDALYLQLDVGGTTKQWTTTQVFRDLSSWYHIVWAVDTTQATATDRMKLYINGSLVTAYSTQETVTQNGTFSINGTTEQRIGSFVDYGRYLNGYLTEFYMVDGQQLAASSFGETDSATGVWKPKAYSGTYGTNGFYLKFADNSGTTSTTLGKDSSGNGNNWTPNNFSVTAGAGNDSMVDSPTAYGTDTGVGGEVRGNYCTWNPLMKASQVTLTNGNLDASHGTFGTNTGVFGGIAVSSGKWYWEETITALSSGAPFIGIMKPEAITQTFTTFYANTTSGYAYRSTGDKRTNSSDSAYGASYTTNDVIGVALDMDAGTLVFYKNGVSQGTAFSSLSGTFVAADANGTSGGTYSSTINFGQRAFAYTAPSGFKALCTTNLPTPTIGATSTTQANDYFDATIYTGNGGTQSIVNSGGFQPDLIWIKGRSVAYDHQLTDSVRGVGKELQTNATNSESSYGLVSAFNSNGFTVFTNGTYLASNQNGTTYVGWQWNAGGSNATNTAGTITSTVRANTTSGFSIVQWTGSGANGTVGHGLGVAPQFMFMKNKTNSGTGWPSYHAFMDASAPQNYYISMASTDAKTAASNAWNNTAPTSSVFSVGSSSFSNGGTMIAYVFAPVAGYSAFGSYTGNGSTDGPFVFTNFRPRFVFWKNASTTGDWQMKDAARSTYNVTNANLYANLSTAENSAGDVDFLSNGFKIRSIGTDVNGSGNTIIYAAFAETPAKFSLAR